VIHGADVYDIDSDNVEEAQEGCNAGNAYHTPSAQRGPRLRARKWTPCPSRGSPTSCAPLA
jgi:hypothetical protein